ncbi:hypothetical protein E2C01_072079 [Portunus trituberculatus]|uniref:Uncharacterized protein n=1 Tax=Portunus trituberculatus TaxID=210409 RepID=A0A5B7HX31_PORTR|nr:hypothetical protein [Portunus trituberculatus]
MASSVPIIDKDLDRAGHFRTLVRTSAPTYLRTTKRGAEVRIVSRFQVCITPTQPASRVFRRVFSSRNMRTFVDGVARMGWDDVLRSDCPNLAFNILSDKINNIFQNNFPFKCIKNKTKNTISYLKSGLINSIKEKHKLAKLSIKWPLTYRNRYKKI